MSPGQPIDGALEPRLEAMRPKLTGYCYRMLGSPFDAEDAVQETMLRALRSLDSFEGRSSLASWVYRIATNVCFDMLEAGKRRSRPMEIGPAGTVASPILSRPAEEWIEPAPEAMIRDESGDPADLVEARETIRLAFLAILQNLPPRQRAVFILREVLRWRASEVADLLDTSVASVNSALQRARATLADAEPDPGRSVSASGLEDPELLDRYVTAFESYDIDSLVALLHEDATFSMPPIELWLRGREQAAGWLLGPGHGCRGSRLLPTTANGSPAFAQYRPSESGSGHDPWALLVLEIESGWITGFNAFLDTGRLFPLFGLPSHLPEGAPIPVPVRA